MKIVDLALLIMAISLGSAGIAALGMMPSADGTATGVLTQSHTTTNFNQNYQVNKWVTDVDQTKLCTDVEDIFERMECFANKDVSTQQLLSEATSVTDNSFFETIGAFSKFIDLMGSLPTGGGQLFDAYFPQTTVDGEENPIYKLRFVFMLVIFFIMAIATVQFIRGQDMES